MIESSHHLLGSSTFMRRMEFSRRTADLLDPTANPTSAATLRLVIDVGEWDNSRYVLLGGQSGNPFSKHYDDHVPLWETGKGFPIPWSPEQVRNAVVHHLELTS